MTFNYKNFSCQAEKYKLDDKSFIIKFFDKSKEHSESEIKDYVDVDAGYGYISLKFKGEDALLSGFLDTSIFTDENMIDSVIEFVESLSPHAKEAYIPHHVKTVKFTGSVQYNGED